MSSDMKSVLDVKVGLLLLYKGELPDPALCGL